MYNVIINLFDVTETADTPDASYEVESVPFSPNYRTNLICSDIAESEVQTQVSVSVDTLLKLRNRLLPNSLSIVHISVLVSMKPAVSLPKGCRLAMI